MLLKTDINPTDKVSQGLAPNLNLSRACLFAELH